MLILMNSSLLAATTIAKYTVCQSQVYLDLVLNDQIWENTKPMKLGTFYHDFRNYYNKRTQNRTDLLDKQRLCRQSLFEAYRFADVNNFSGGEIN